MYPVTPILLVSLRILFPLTKKRIVREKVSKESISDGLLVHQIDNSWPFCSFQSSFPFEERGYGEKQKNIHTVDGQIYIQYVYMEKKHFFFIYVCTVITCYIEVSLFRGL